MFDILVTMLFVFAHNSPAKMDPQGYEPLYICAHPAMLTGAPRLWIVGKSDRRYVKSFWRGHYDYTRLKRPVDEGLWTRYQSDEYDVAISAAFEPPARVTVRRSQLTYDCALHSTP